MRQVCNRFAVAALCFCTAVILGGLGCGSGTVSGFNNSGPASGIISPVGGSLSSGSATLTIPAGAVPSDTTFTLGQASTYPSNTELLAGSAYTVTYSGVFLTQPMTLTIAYTPLPTGDVASSLVLYRVVNTAWQAVANSSVNTSTGVVTASIQAAGTYGIFVTQTSKGVASGTILLNRGAHTAANSVAVMNIDGSGYKSLLTSAAGVYVSNAHYSPNGATIAYDYTDGTHGFYIYTMNADGTGATKLLGGALKPDSTYSSNTHPAYSADGTTIAYASDVTGTPQIYTMPSAGGTSTQCTTMLDSAITNVGFNKAGNIAFYATVAGVGAWYQVSPTGTGFSPINSAPANIALVAPWTAYSPSGTSIATGYQQLGAYDLYAFSLNGSVRTRLTSLSAAAIIAPHFSSDGSKIVFEAVSNGSGSIYTVNVDGTGLANLTVSSGPDALFDLH